MKAIKMKEEDLTPSKCEESAAAPSKPAPIEGSCHFFIERKKRYCRFRPAKESNFCAEHRTAFQVFKVFVCSIGPDKESFLVYNCNYFLPIDLNICFGCSKEQSH